MVDDADYTVITRRDAEDTVVMSLDYFNSLLEAVDDDYLTILACRYHY